MIELEPDEIARIDLARLSLARGGHKREPSVAVQLAAVNYIVREALAAKLFEGLQEGWGALRFDYETRTLLYQLTPKEDDKSEMQVATVSRAGKVEWL